MQPEIQGRFRGQKDGTTQNVLVAISFDLKFTYILVGWEGSAYDSRVLNDALTRLGGIYNSRRNGMLKQDCKGRVPKSL